MCMSFKSSLELEHIINHCLTFLHGCWHLISSHITSVPKTKNKTKQIQYNVGDKFTQQQQKQQIVISISELLSPFSQAIISQTVPCFSCDIWCCRPAATGATFRARRCDHINGDFLRQRRLQQWGRAAEPLLAVSRCSSTQLKRWKQVQCWGCWSHAVLKALEGVTCLGQPSWQRLRGDLRDDILRHGRGGRRDYVRGASSCGGQLGQQHRFHGLEVQRHGGLRQNLQMKKWVGKGKCSVSVGGRLTQPRGLTQEPKRMDKRMWESLKWGKDEGCQMGNGVGDVVPHLDWKTNLNAVVKIELSFPVLFWVKWGISLHILNKPKSLNKSGQMTSFIANRFCV